MYMQLLAAYVLFTFNAAIPSSICQMHLLEGQMPKVAFERLLDWMSSQQSDISSYTDCRR